MICKLCNSEYKGHFNSKYCSNACKKKVITLTKKKYRDKISKIKSDEIENKIELLDGEIWKDIINYEDLYQISNYGRVKSKYRQGGGGLLKPNLGKRGYYYVRLSNKSIRKNLTIHRLIAVHFIENPNNLPMVDHIDRDKQNNKIENLRWVTCKENNINSSRVINKKGSLLTVRDKRKNKIYTYYRVYWYGDNKQKSKRFKNLNDAEEFKNNLYNIVN